jgi:hypothetical protein
MQVSSESPSNQLIIRSALATAVCLSGGMLVGLLVGFGISGLPIHVPELTRNIFSGIAALAGVLAGGALWGRAIGRLAGQGSNRRMAAAGALSFGPGVILAGIGLASLEVAIVERGRGPDLPIHNVFTLLFVPAVFFVAGLGGLGLGLALKRWALAWQLAAFAGLAAGLAFLAVDLGMDALGWRVGAPGAAERATMITVLLVGSLGATLAGAQPSDTC